MSKNGTDKIKYKRREREICYLAFLRAKITLESTQLDIRDVHIQKG